MADEENTELEEGEEGAEGEEGGAKKAGMMKIILLINGLLLVIGIGVGAAMYFMGGEEETAAAQEDTETLEEMAAEGEPVKKKKSKKTPVYIPLRPAFVVNFENQDQVSFLQVDIQLMTYDGSVEAAIKTHMPAVRNELLLLLGGKQYHEINTREGKRALSQESIQVIQDVLKSVDAPHSIEALYFTSFVMQ